ncbi:uncharacterized protein LOC129942878 [Eupeodes corollae]|uniref:uncharacterized protein LOC129939828 n=1 Tax=Eupeodes corollae TaxID=290404 RepID=UPI0024902B13|nr:uncharacterized protein LOC129939828 [Eupeodes corollae]XP_055903967.1 uncharacterized protein LOC129939828 [Eupeodes corollae]XP_055907971.1 uncharacterized protein LOC129942878 [Eupeodes corollae]XP_055907972.1 uncharacterized protein LOC129942878 [Eupeodes corollae]
MSITSKSNHLKCDPCQPRPPCITSLSNLKSKPISDLKRSELQSSSSICSQKSESRPNTTSKSQSKLDALIPEPEAQQSTAPYPSNVNSETKPDLKRIKSKPSTLIQSQDYESKPSTTSKSPRNHQPVPLASAPSSLSLQSVSSQLDSLMHMDKSTKSLLKSALLFVIGVSLARNMRFIVDSLNIMK